MSHVYIECPSGPVFSFGFCGFIDHCQGSSSPSDALVQGPTLLRCRSGKIGWQSELRVGRIETVTLLERGHEKRPELRGEGHLSTLTNVVMGSIALLVDLITTIHVPEQRRSSTGEF